MYSALIAVLTVINLQPYKSGKYWHQQQEQQTTDRKNKHISTVKLMHTQR